MSRLTNSCSSRERRDVHGFCHICGATRGGSALRRVVHAVVDQKDVACRPSDCLYVTIGPMTLVQTSPLVASTWASGLSPASPKHGITLFAILSSGFTSHTVRVGVLYSPQSPNRPSADHQSKVFEPTTIEIRFQHLHKVEEESQQGSLVVPVIQRHPSPEDGPGYVRSVSVFSFFFGSLHRIVQVQLH